ncbi:MAG: nuclear transport factor 2 family protein, partial [Candidatus Binatia bacterium]
EGPPDGRVEIEILRLIEVDEEGRCVAVLLFDLEDAGEAQREAWARWVAAEPAVAPLVTVLSEHVDGWNEKDRDRLLLACAPDIIVEDHRRTGMGRLEGAEAYVESVAALWELAPDSIIEAGWFWLAVEPHGAVVAGRRFGRLADGGDFESDFLALFTVADGRSTRLELFEIDDVDTALARFEALR